MGSAIRRPRQLQKPQRLLRWLMIALVAVGLMPGRLAGRAVRTILGAVDVTGGSRRAAPAPRKPADAGLGRDLLRGGGPPEQSDGGSREGHGHHRNTEGRFRRSRLCYGLTSSSPTVGSSATVGASRSADLTGRRRRRPHSDRLR
jgi:hypothetical protein